MKPVQGFLGEFPKVQSPLYSLETIEVLVGKEGWWQAGHHFGENYWKLISSMAGTSGHAGVSHWQCTLLVAVCLILPRELCFMYNVQWVPSCSWANCPAITSGAIFWLLQLKTSLSLLAVNWLSSFESWSRKPSVLKGSLKAIKQVPHT